MKHRGRMARRTPRTKATSLPQHGAVYGDMGDFRRLAFAVTVLITFHTACEAASIDAASSDFLSRLNDAVTGLAGKTGQDAYVSCQSYVRSLLDLDVSATDSRGRLGSHVPQAAERLPGGT